MTSDSQKHFLAERARALATVILTRRDDLTVVDTKKETGLDFHVYIERDDKPMRLTFGVLLRGVLAGNIRTCEQGSQTDDGTVSRDAEVPLPRMPFLLCHARRAGVLFMARGAGCKQRFAEADALSGGELYSSNGRIAGERR